MSVFSYVVNNMFSSKIGVKLFVILHNVKIFFLKIKSVNFKKNIPLLKNCNEARPEIFFIVGSGRSGNTLLRAILSANKRIVIPPELYSLQLIIRTVIKNRHLKWDELCNNVVASFYDTPDTDVWEINREELLQDLLNYDKASQNVQDLVFSFYKFYAKQKGMTESIVVGDKTPLNAYNLWWIKEIFPHAKYIHMHRDGRDVVLSYVKSGLYESYVNAAHRWNNSVNRVVSFGKKMKPSYSFSACSYENLVLDSRSEIKKICDFLDIDYSDEMLVSYQNQFKTMGDTTKFSHHQNVQKSVFTSSIGKWKKMNKEDLEAIIPIIENNLKELGYGA